MQSRREFELHLDHLTICAKLETAQKRRAHCPIKAKETAFAGGDFFQPAITTRTPADIELGEMGLWASPIRIT
jgi:hypothetical protein